VLGYVDELVLLPLAIAAVLRLIGSEILSEHRATAARIAARPVSMAGAATVVATWLAACALLAWPLWRG
jgi:uncharacterized membrane protein YkvA (DUF1232 family)